MTVNVDKMTAEDVPEVMAIERDSFMTPWPSSAYRRELHENKLAHYLVLRQCEATAGPPIHSASTTQSPERRGFWSSLLHKPPAPVPADGQVTLAGYAGLWLMVDEAHVTTIAVRPEYRGRGLGELLLVALSEIAMDINARWLTLEVRVSNEVAQSLYRKYSFKPAGVRQRYYSDNQEDALIMWTDEIQAPEYQERFTALRNALRDRLVRQQDFAPDTESRQPESQTR